MLIASSNFLVPNATLIVEIVAFLIVLLVIGRYVLPLLNEKLEERQEEIRKSLEVADLAKAEAEETRAQRDGILADARQQARDIVAKANRSAEQLKEESITRGEQEFERLVASSRAEIALERQRALDELSSQVASLVISTASRVVAREVDATLHSDLIDEAIAALQAESGSLNP